MKQKQGGFVIVFFSIFFVCLVGIFLGVFYFLAVIKTEIEVTNLCRQQNLITQAEVAEKLNQLLGLNPEAEILDFELKTAEAELSIAMAAGDAFLAGHLKMTIINIKFKQSQLGIKQKVLIGAANGIAKTGEMRVRSLIQRVLMKVQLDVSPHFLMSSQFLKSRSSALHVYPKTASLAPVYDVQSGFSELQSLEHMWHYQIETPLASKSFFSAIWKGVNKSCGASLFLEGQIWKPGLIKVK